MSDAVSITKVCLPDAKSYQLVSAIKQEPADYNDCGKTPPRLSTASPIPLQVSCVGTVRRPSPLSCLPNRGDLAQDTLPATSRTFGTSPVSKTVVRPLDENMPNISSFAYIPSGHLPSAPSSVVPSLTPILVSGMLTGHSLSQPCESDVGTLLPTSAYSANASASSSVLGIIANQSGYPTNPSLGRPLLPSVIQRPGAFSQFIAPNTISTSLVSSTIPPPPVFNGMGSTSSFMSVGPVVSRFPLRYDCPVPPVPRSSLQFTFAPSLTPVISKTKSHAHEPHLHVPSNSAFNETSPTSVLAGSSSSLCLRGSSFSVPMQTDSVFSASSAPAHVNVKTATTKFAPSCAPETNSSLTEPDQSLNQSFAWGRVVRLHDGALHFPGVGNCVFSGAESVLRRIRTTALSVESFSLQLPFEALNFQLPAAALTNNWLTCTSSTCGSRTGFHVCLCCHQSFSNRALYDSHMMRPVARIFYRCHLCRGSEIAHIPSVDSVSVESNAKSFSESKVLFDQSAVTVSTCASPANSTHHSPYCTVLFGGIIKASNRCAVYSHFAYAHPTELNSWELQPSLISVCPLSESAWGPVSFKLGAQLYDSTPNELTPDTQSPSVSSAAVTGPVFDENSEPDVGRSPSTLDHSVFYRRGLELVDVWRDFELAVTYAMQLQELTMLNRPTQPVSLRRSFSPSHSLTSSSFPIELDAHSAAHWSPLKRLYTLCHGSSAPPLPHPTSPLTQTILHCARAKVWHSHVFLTDAIQNCCTTSDPIVIDDTTDSQEDGDNITEAAKQRCLPPSAPSDQVLHQALSLFRNQQFTSISSTTPNNDPSTIITPSEPATDSSANPQPGFLRCLMCSFRTNCVEQLTEHLSGSRPFVLTRCALCSQSVCLRQPSLCAVKAHLLLHLGYFLMCPHCGFTPPPYLALDAAELCLRVHLRFVCFHFNILQVYVCALCNGRGKAYNSPTHLCQHIFEAHTKRAYMCLWCSRQTTGLVNEKSASTNVTSKISTDSLHSNGGSRTTDQSASRSTNSDSSVGRSPRMFSTAKELFAHLQAVHRHILSVPPGTNAVDCEAKQTVIQMSDASKRPEVSTSIPLPGAITSEPFIVEKGGESLLNLVTKVDFLHCYVCPECEDTFERRDTFTHHFWTTHSLSSSSVPCFRCFGTCKRLSFDLTEFRQHFNVCPIATEFYAATFTTYPPQHKCVSKVNETEQSIKEAAFSRHSDGSHPLCFCFHCGIGARRTTVTSFTSAGGNDAVTEDTCEFNGLSIDEPASTDAPPSFNGQTNCVNPSDLASVAQKEQPTQYDAHYFADLLSLHAHEDQVHLTKNDSAIACPWCGHRLSCRSSTDIRFTLRHLHSHVERNNFFAWHSERKRKWKDSIKDLPHCYCGAALLDSPLAIVAHASDHLLISNPISLAPSSPQPVAPDASKPTSFSRTFITLNQSNSASSGLLSRSHLFGPGPGAHVPCPVDIYRHLRFVVSPELDSYLDNALLLSRPFVCPLCATHCPTRWALSEHAFMEHWGVLCYICCLVVTSKDITSKIQFADKPLTVLHNTSSTQSAPVESIENTNTHSRSSDLLQTANFWDHIYQCLLDRHHSLKSVPSSSETENGEAVPAFDSTNEPHSGFPSGQPSVVASMTASAPNSPSVGDSPPGNLTPSHVDSRHSSSRDQPMTHASYRCDVNSVQRRRKRLVVEDNEDGELDRASMGYAPSEDSIIDMRPVDSQKKRHTSNSPPTLFVEQDAQMTADHPMLCALCGEQQSLDTWEDHSLTHRNPRMVWNGIQLTRPQRIVLSHRQSKVYKCYICSRRFVTRFGCQRHLTSVHKLAKSRIDWDSLLDTDHNRGGKHPTAEPAKNILPHFARFSDASKSNSNTPVPSRSSIDHSTSFAIRSEASLPHTSLTIRQSSTKTNIERQNECESSDVYCCAICRIPFLSHRSLSIHQIAAHGSTM